MKKFRLDKIKELDHFKFKKIVDPINNEIYISSHDLKCFFELIHEKSNEYENKLKIKTFVFDTTERYFNIMQVIGIKQLCEYLLDLDKQ